MYHNMARPQQMYTFAENGSTELGKVCIKLVGHGDMDAVVNV